MNSTGNLVTHMDSSQLIGGGSAAAGGNFMKSGANQNAPNGMMNADARMFKNIHEMLAEHKTRLDQQ